MLYCGILFSIIELEKYLGYRNMLKALGSLLALNYFLLNILAFHKIETFNLDVYQRLTILYNPFTSALFSFESILLYMVLAGTIIGIWINRIAKNSLATKIAGYITVIFAMAAVPIKLATHNLLIYDTAFYAFIIFFSAPLLYIYCRILFNTDYRPTLKEGTLIAAVLAIFFLHYEPWNSPSLKLNYAIKNRNASRFVALAQKYPMHVRHNPWLLNKAFAHPDMTIIKTIAKAGNKSIRSSYMNQEIFHPDHIEILKYLSDNGFDLANISILRNAVEYTCQIDGRLQTGSAGNKASPYPVLSFLIELYHQSPENLKNKYDSGSGYKNPVSIAASKGNLKIMKFLVQNKFKIDEEVFLALVRNEHISDPAIQTLLRETEFVSDKTDKKTETSSQLPEKHNSETISPPGVDSGLQIKLAPDGLDLVLTSGFDVKSERANQNNIFHYLAGDWKAMDLDSRWGNVDFSAVFNEAIKRNIDLNHKNKSGTTPLGLAIFLNNFRACNKFIEAGANKNILIEGLTPRQFCLKNNQLILMSLFKEEAHNEGNER